MSNDENISVSAPGSPSLFWSPKDESKHASYRTTRRPFQELSDSLMPDSPPEKEHHHLNSDDFVRTSEIRPDDDHRIADMVYSPPSQQQPLIVVGGREEITFGRGGAATVKIGKRNRQISRLHARIEYDRTNKEFKLVVLGLNGLSVDDVPYKQHDIVTLRDESLIDILGCRIVFMCPEESVLEDEPTPQADLSPERPLSPAPEEPPAQNDEPPAKSEEQQKEEEGEDKEKEEKPDNKQTSITETNFTDIIIDTLVFSRKSSMTASDICSRIMSTNPAYREQPREVWMERITKVLKEKPFFGEIVRKGKTADGSPKENLYYYNSEADPVEWRRAEYTQVGRSARKCTLQDKQYFWKIPPKLGRNRNSYVPPPAKAYESEQSPASSSRRQKGRKDKSEEESNNA